MRALWHRILNNAAVALACLFWMLVVVAVFGFPLLIWRAI